MREREYNCAAVQVAFVIPAGRGIPNGNFSGP
jgi:hypothetical protein